jgi:PAS domain S-box-containing protein
MRLSVVMNPVRQPFQTAIAVRFTLAVIVLVAITLGGVVFHDLGQAWQSRYADFINDSGRQRMLAQRTALLAFRLASPLDDAERTARRRELLAVAGELERVHRGLAERIGRAEVPASPEGVEHVRQTEPQLRRYLVLLRDFAATPGDRLDSGDSRLDAIGQLSDELAGLFDGMTAAYTRAIVETAGRHKLSDWVVLAIQLAVIAAIAGLVLWPLMRRLREESASLDALNRTLESQVAERTAVAEERARQLFASHQDQARANQALATLIANSPVPVVGLDAAGRVTTWSPAAERMFGWPAAEAIGRLLPIVPDDRMEEFRAHVARVMAGERLENVELTRRRRDGTPLDILLSAAPLRDHEGRAGGIIAAMVDISERRRTLEALARSEERLRSIVENMPVMMDAFDDKGNIVVWNRECERVTGYAAAEVVGNPRAMELFYPDAAYRERMLAEWERRGNDYLDWEWEMTAKDGGKRIVAWSNLSDRFPIPGWARWGTGVDVTARRQAERELRASNERIADILESIRDVFFTVDRDWRVTYFNPRAEERFAILRTVIIGRSLWDALPEMASYFYLRLKTVIDRREPITFVGYYPPLDIWFDVRGVPMAEGAAFYFLDITERVTAENAAREQERRLATIMDSVPHAIVTIDSSGLIQSFNQAAEAMFGWPIAEAIGRPATVLMPEGYRGRHQAGLLAYRRSGEGRVVGKGPVELEGLRRDGTVFPISITLGEIGQGERRGFVGIIQDITDRQRAELERSAMEYELHQAQKMEALGQIAGGMAHEFNNILVPMIGLTELAIEDVPEGGPQRRRLETVLAAAERARRLIRKILSFSRMEERQAAATILNDVLRDSVTLLRAGLPTTIRLSVGIPADPVVAVCDPNDIHQVIMNLATNARDAIGARTNGVIEVSVGARQVAQAEGPLAVGELRPGPYAVLAVRDNGDGMDEEVKGKVFEPFFTTKDVGFGTGMGMAVIHGIVSAAGGAIRLDSAPGRGTTIEVYFPALPAEAAAAPNPQVQEMQGQDRI